MTAYIVLYRMAKNLSTRTSGLVNSISCYWYFARVIIVETNFRVADAALFPLRILDYYSEYMH